jgi:hypothetical protein
MSDLEYFSHRVPRLNGMVTFERALSPGISSERVMLPRTYAPARLDHLSTQVDYSEPAEKSEPARSRFDFLNDEED